MLPDKILKTIEELKKRYPEERAALIPALHLVQNEYRFIPTDAMKELSTLLNVPLNEVKRVASFYSMFTFNKTGKHRVWVCKTLSCQLNGSNNLLKSLQSHFNIRVGETTKDDKFTLFAAECLAACDRGPVMIVDETLYTNLDSKKAIKILEEL